LRPPPPPNLKIRSQRQYSANLSLIAKCHRTCSSHVLDRYNARPSIPDPQTHGNAGFKKGVNRATTQVLMKTGSVERTNDRDFETEQR
jgi:hypothetical protein